MGIELSKCVNLAGETSYLDEDYHVVRTSGAEEDGWTLTEEPHRCSRSTVAAAAHATLNQNGWALHLHTGDQADAAHCCGWRPLGGFWPSRLTGDKEAIEAWTEQLRDRLEELAGHQGLPDLWAEHCCSRGAPPDYCDGCCAERRAKEKKAILDELDAIAAERKALEKQLDDILCEKEQMHITQDLWESAVEQAWDDLEEAECEISRKHYALDEKAFPLEKALKKIPTAAQHREWLAAKELDAIAAEHKALEKELDDILCEEALNAWAKKTMALMDS
jgi:hypothetical protein